MIWYDMIWYDMIWYDMIWYDMIWYDMIWYLTIIPRTRVGYELLDSGRGAKHRVGYHKLISNKREWNNCFIKYQTLDKFTKISGILFPTGYRKIIVYINQSKSNCQLSQIMHDSVRLCARTEKRPFSNMCHWQWQTLLLIWQLKFSMTRNTVFQSRPTCHSVHNSGGPAQ